MLEVDGGAGGGQLVRSALTLSMLRGDPVRIENVRGNRSESGLKPQHLAVVETAAAVCDATVEGAEHGSEDVTFEPGRPTGGTYEADIGTAGSVTLLFDTFLPLAVHLDEPLVVTATGGTDVKWSPPLAYYRWVKLPLLRAHGLAAVVELDRTGFYPAGGGTATLRVWPSSLSPLDLVDPGPVTGARVYSKASADLADPEVAERQAATAVAELDGLDAFEAGDDERGEAVETVERQVSYVDAASPGSVVVVRIDREGSLAGFDAYGEPGKPAEAVAGDATEGIESIVDSGAAIDDHLADQVLVFLALAGGRVSIPGTTDHVESSLDLLKTFEYEVTGESTPDGVRLEGA